MKNFNFESLNKLINDIQIFLLHLRMNYIWPMCSPLYDSEFYHVSFYDFQNKIKRFELL